MVTLNYEVSSNTELLTDGVYASSKLADSQCEYVQCYNDKHRSLIAAEYTVYQQRSSNMKHIITVKHPSLSLECSCHTIPT